MPSFKTYVLLGTSSSFRVTASHQPGERKCMAGALTFPQGWSRKLLLEALPALYVQPCQWLPKYIMDLVSPAITCSRLNHWWEGREELRTWFNESHSHNHCSEMLEAGPVHAPMEPAGAAKTERRGDMQWAQIWGAAVPPGPVPSPKGLFPPPPDLSGWSPLHSMLIKCLSG